MCAKENEILGRDCAASWVCFLTFSVTRFCETGGKELDLRLTSRDRGGVGDLFQAEEGYGV